MSDDPQHPNSDGVNHLRTQSDETQLPEEPTHGEKHTGLTIVDAAEPRSVYNLVPSEVQEALERVPKEAWRYSFKALENHARPTVREYQLRVSFWNEYQSVQDKFKKRISIVNVTNGVCPRTYFYDEILTNPLKLAFMMYPPTDYIAAMEEMHDFACRELRKILSIPNMGKKGANLPVIKEKIKIFALLENRLRGAKPRKVVHNTYNAPTQVNNLEPGNAPQSVQDIEKEIRRIERTVKEAVKDPQGEAIALEAAPVGGEMQATTSSTVPKVEE